MQSGGMKRKVKSSRKKKRGQESVGRKDQIWRKGESDHSTQNRARKKKGLKQDDV